MRTFYFIIAVSLAAFVIMPAEAQKRLQDVIYLKDSTVVTGVIAGQIYGKSITILTFESDTLTYAMDDIATYAIGVKTGRNSSGYQYRSVLETPKTKGYYGTVEVSQSYVFGTYGLNGGLDDPGYYRMGHSGFSFTMVNGWQIDKWLALGVGIGYNGYWKDVRFATIPVYLHARSYLKDLGKITPFVSMDIGYNVGLTRSRLGGFMINPYTGVAFRISMRNMLTVGLGYYGYAPTTTKVTYPDGVRYSEDVNRLTSAINLKLGVTF